MDSIRLSAPFVHATLSLALALVASPARAQYIPVRDLDPGRVADFDFPIKTVGGNAAGQALKPGGNLFQPVLWDLAGAHFLPLPPPTTEGYAYDLDAVGTIVGTTYDVNSGTLIPVAWTNGVATDLNTLLSPGSNWVLYEARAIDERGRIACTGYGGTTLHAVILDQGQVTDLGGLPKTDYYAMAMNEDGVVGGQYILQSNFNAAYAFLIRDGQLVDLHAPAFMGGKLETVWDVDRFGRAVGNYDTASVGLDLRAYWFDGSASVDLAPAFPPGPSTATGINDFGVIVGSYTTAAGTPSAYAWQAGCVFDLNTLIDPNSGWLLQSALGVDDDGRIVGNGTVNGVASSFILEPICNGSFTNYGSGCAGSNGVEPRLRGAGCPGPDRDFALEIVDGVPAGFGFVLFGLGTGTVPVKPGCDLQILPLLPPVVPIVLDAHGKWWDAERLPIGTPVFDLNLQALFFDAGAAHGISGTKPVALHFE